MRFDAIHEDVAFLPAAARFRVTTGQRGLVMKSGIGLVMVGS
jgi:hypothetical protein